MITALSWWRGFHNSKELWAMLCRVTQNRWATVKSSDKKVIPWGEKCQPAPVLFLKIPHTLIICSLFSICCMLIGNVLPRKHLKISFNDPHGSCNYCQGAAASCRKLCKTSEFAAVLFEVPGETPNYDNWGPLFVRIVDNWSLTLHLNLGIGQSMLFNSIILSFK